MNTIFTQVRVVSLAAVLAVTFTGNGMWAAAAGFPTSPAVKTQDPWAPYRRSQPTLPTPQAPTAEVPVGDELQQRVSRRYRSGEYQRMLQSMSSQSAWSLYQEAMQMVDSRHVEPVSYQTRLNGGINNLLAAIRNPEFRNVFRMSATPQAVTEFEQTLVQTRDRYPVTNGQQAGQFTQWVAGQAQSRLGLNPTAVYLEFTEGAISSLDKYSSIVPLDRTGQLDVMNESVVGIGVEILADTQGVKVQKVLTGGPAADAGLKKGDVITGIGGQAIAGMDLENVVSRITGPAGSPVQLDLTRGTQRGRVTLYRRSVQIRSVSDVQMLDAQTRTGYIKLEQFSSTTTKELDEALYSLHNQGMQNLVLDLRGNPGGLLTTAIEVSDRFLPSGTIVSTRGRTAADNSVEKATYDRTWKVPLVVLIDDQSASASEIFAAAIQENQRGLIVGRTSYGKGTVQTHFPLQTVGANLKLTTAYFFSPNDRRMAGTGVTPDVAINEHSADNLVDDADVAAAIWLTRGGQAQDLANRAPQRRGFSG